MRTPPGVSGAAAERAAEAHLKARGLATLARNYRCKGGEIDLVMRERDTLVFVEVRLRANRAFGPAQATVDARKQGRIARCAQRYLQAAAAAAPPPCRFDVVALSRAGDQYDINWIRDAFSL